jgi:hypothetical protein
MATTMSRPETPFASVNGRPYLIVNYELEPRGTLPSLHDLLKGLLVHNDPADILLLRPLGRAEMRLLRQSTEGAAVEAWAQIAPTVQDRFGRRDQSKRPSRRARARRGRAGR